MSFLNIFKSGSKKAVVEGERGLIMLLEKMGLNDVVDEAQISQYEDALDKVSVLAAKAKTKYDQEHREFLAIKVQYDEKLADAQSCQEKITSATTPLDLKHKLDAHLSALLDEIEAMKPELDREEQEALEEFDHYTMLKETVELKAGQLAKAKTALQTARRENQKLDVQMDRIKEREDQQKVLMGIREQTSSLDSVLDAINADNTKKREKIEASKLRVDALKIHEKPASGASSIDPEVAAAIGKGTSMAPKMSAADRLAALSGKK